MQKIGDMQEIIVMLWQILQQVPDDYVIAEPQYSVKEFINICKT